MCMYKVRSSHSDITKLGRLSNFRLKTVEGQVRSGEVRLGHFNTYYDSHICIAVFSTSSLHFYTKVHLNGCWSPITLIRQIPILLLDFWTRRDLSWHLIHTKLCTHMPIEYRYSSCCVLNYVLRYTQAFRRYLGTRKGGQKMPPPHGRWPGGPPPAGLIYKHFHGWVLSQKYYDVTYFHMRRSEVLRECFTFEWFPVLFFLEKEASVFTLERTIN